MVTFDFKSALKYAIDNSPDLNSFRRTYKISKIEHKNKKADFLPNMDITSSHIFRNKPVGVNNNGASSIGIEVTENLYKNGENITNYKKTKLKQEFALIQFYQKRDQLIRAISRDYLDFSLSKELFVIKEKNYSLLKEQYQKASIQYKQGLKPKKDVIRFKSQMQQANIGLLQSKNKIESSRQKLLAKMGYAINGKTNIRIAFVPIKLPTIKVSDVPVKDPDIKRQYQYKMISLQKKTNEFDVSLARRKYWPEINMTAGATYGNDLQSGVISSFGRKKDFNWRAGLELKYKLLDWGKGKRDIDKTIQNGLRAVDGLNNQLVVVKQDIENIMSGLNLRKKSYRISKSLKQTELENYITIDNSYHRGDTDYLDLTTAIKDLSEAKVQYAIDRYTLEKDLYAYYYYMGTIYAKVFK